MVIGGGGGRIEWANVFDYRPQCSCGKVMFLHLSVILFTGGVSAPVHAGIHTPLGRHPLGRHPPAQCMLGYTPPPPAQCILGYTSPCPVHAGNTPPCPVHAGIHMATAADGTHPTGLHSCLNVLFLHGLFLLCTNQQ